MSARPAGGDVQHGVERRPAHALYGFTQAPDYGWTALRILAAFGIGVLGSLTLARYRSHLPPAASARARTGLAQAFADAGGAHTPSGTAATAAYCSGLHLALLVGAALVAATAAAISAALPATVRTSTAPSRPRVSAS